MIRCILFFLLSIGLIAQEIKIQVLATTDTHGSILPENPYTLKPELTGWARLATAIRRMKAKNPNTVLVDCGDTLQGDPICYVRNQLQSNVPEPATAIMNDLGYHAMTVGNHDLDWGMPIARAIESQATFPWLGANMTFQGKSAFTPYVVREVGGVRVGILGLCNSQIGRYRSAQPLEVLNVTDAIAMAQRYVPVLKDKEKADVVVALFHSGVGNVATKAGDEHQAIALVDRVPGIDVVMGGHSHHRESLRHKGVPIMVGGSHGELLAVVDLTLKKERGGWQVTSRDGRLMEMTADLPLDGKVLELTDGLRKYTDRYLNTYATTLGVDLDGRWSRTQDTALVQLLHKVQKRATGAMLSAAPSPSTKFFVPRGPTSIRQFWAMAPTECRVAKITLKGFQVKLWLEQAASAFNYCHQTELFNKEVSPYNYDIMDGVNYTFDLSRPVGQRVVDLRYQGQPIRENQVFTLALTTHRLAGDGGYLDAIGFKGAPDMIHSTSLRNLLLDYVMGQSVVNVPYVESWRIIPALDRERILNQGR